MKFKGTIVITDPCYLINGLSEELDNKYWEASNYGEDLSAFGCSQWISENTLYGDWSCFTYKGTEDELLKIIEQWNGIYLDFFSKYNTVGVTDKEKEILLKEYTTK